MVRRSIIGVAIAATMIGGMAGAAFADTGQTSGGSTTANVAVESGITMTGLTPSFTLTGTPGATVTGLGDVTLNVETNNVAGYAVTVESATHTMLPALGGNADSIPIAALTVRESGGGAYSPVSDTGVVTVHSQDVRSLDGGDTLSNDFQMRIPTVNVDTYSASLNYIATSF